MDDSMLDLFGEDVVNDGLAALQVQEPEPPSVIRRTDQLQRTGCCQRLTWSRNATLAYLAPDDRTINFRLVARDPDTSEWVLTNDSPSPVVAPDDLYFVHVQWSSVGMDMVALDQYGRPHLYQLAFALDRVQAHALAPGSTPEELTTVVGLHWLPVHPVQFRPPHLSIGTRDGDEWSNKMGVTSIDWPRHHLDTKSAFLLLTEAHILKLYYQQESGPWSEATTSLWESGNSEDILTHAAFSDENKFLHLVTYSSRGALRLYKIIIDWSVTQNRDPTRPPQIVQAQLRVECLHKIEAVITQPPAETSLDVQQGLFRSRLTSLTILPPSPFLDSKSSQVQAIFSYAGDMYGPQSPSTSCSAVLRWDISNEEPELLDIWKTFKSGSAKLTPEASTALSSDTITTLRRVPDQVLPRTILTASTVLSEPYLVLATSDGSIDFYSRTDLQMLTTDDDDTKASSYAQSGFAFLRTERFSDVALVPDASIAAVRTDDGRIVLKIIDYLPGWDSSGAPDFRTQAALCTIARNVATLTGLVTSNDEPLALLPPSLPISHRLFLIKQIYRMLQRPFDFTLEESRKMLGRIMRDNLLAKTLSIHLFLTSSSSDTLDLAGKVLWLSLNLRLHATSIAATVTPKDPTRADALVALIPCVKWCIDLCIMILDDMAEVLKATTPAAGAETVTVSHKHVVALLAQSASPTLLFLLGSTPRALLRTTLDLLKLFFPKMVQSTPGSVQQRVAAQDVLSYYRALPFKLLHFDGLLTEIDSVVRAAYTSAKLSSAQRVEAEVSMLVDAQVPDVLHTVVEHVFSPKVAGKMVEQLDLGVIWGWDTSGLGMSAGASRERGGRWDVVRKTKVRDGVRVRVCKRCGSVMEDTWEPKDRQGLPAWLQNAQRHCVCLGYWMLER